ncbi:MAG: ABC transporter permease subunit [Clostridiaceae bacterium]
MNTTITAGTNANRQLKPRQSLLKYIWKNRFMYALMVLPLLYYIIFQYIPIYGVSIAFQDYMPGKPFIGNPWIGLKNFELVFSSRPFLEALRNTVLISFYKIIFGFPFPIMIALLLNELRAIKFKKIVQTLIYFPHFVSWVIIGAIILTFFSVNDGLLNVVLKNMGFETVSVLTNPRYFRPMLVLSSMWKEAGMNSIIYLAAIAGVDIQVYEAALIDGASRWQQMKYITLPGIASTVSIMFILQLGGILSAGMEQTLVLLNPLVASVGENIDTFVYKVGLKQGDYSFSTAVGLFKSAVGYILVMGTNRLSKVVKGEGIF